MSGYAAALDRIAAAAERIAEALEAGPVPPDLELPEVMEAVQRTPEQIGLDDAAQRGIPLADFECRHGYQPHDRNGAGCPHVGCEHHRRRGAGTAPASPATAGAVRELARRTVAGLTLDGDTLSYEGRTTTVRQVIARTLATLIDGDGSLVQVDDLYRANDYPNGQPKDSRGEPTTRTHHGWVRLSREALAAVGANPSAVRTVYRQGVRLDPRTLAVES